MTSVTVQDGRVKMNKLVSITTQKVKQAIKNGELTRPVRCQECGSKANRIEGHHEDYGKPLEVIWLCTRCHSYRHNANRSEETIIGMNNSPNRHLVGKRGPDKRKRKSRGCLRKSDLLKSYLIGD